MKDLRDLRDLTIHEIQLKPAIRWQGCTPGVKVFLQEERLKVKNFEEYCKLYLASVGREKDDGKVETPAHYTRHPTPYTPHPVPCIPHSTP